MEEKTSEKLTAPSATSKKSNKKSFITIAIWIISLLGFLTATLYIYYDGERSLDLLTDWFDKIIQNKYNKNILELFLSNINSGIVYILLIFALGFSPVFSLIISCIPFFKGFGVGLMTTYIYINYGWRGLIYESLIDIPTNILVIYIIVLSTKEAIKFSNGIYSAIKNRVIYDISLKKYFFKFFIIMLIFIIIIMLRSIIEFIFFRYFNVL